MLILLLGPDSYQLLRLGKAGYRAIMSNVTQTADHLAEAITQMGGGKLFRLISAGQGNSLPLVAFQIAEDKPYDEFAIATHLRQRGWIVPAYTMAPHTEKMKLLRVVVREDFSRSRCDTFIRDLSNAIDWLEAAPVAVQTHLSKSDEGDKSKSDNPKHPHDHTTIHHHEKHSLAGQHGKTHAVC